MLRNEKEAVIAEVTQLLTDTENVFVSDYRGLTVAQLKELRDKLRESGASFRVVKNTLSGIAADRADRGAIKEMLSGPTAVTFCGEDLGAAAKALSEFARTHPQLEVRGGLLDASVIDAAGVKGMTVLELSEMVKALEEEFGVSAAPPVAAAAAPAADAAPAEAAEEQTQFDVMLTAFGAQKIQVIKVVRALTRL